MDKLAPTFASVKHLNGLALHCRINFHQATWLMILSKGSRPFCSLLTVAVEAVTEINWGPLPTNVEWCVELIVANPLLYCSLADGRHFTSLQKLRGWEDDNFLFLCLWTVLYHDVASYLIIHSEGSAQWNGACCELNWMAACLHLPHISNEGHCNICGTTRGWVWGLSQNQQW